MTLLLLTTLLVSGLVSLSSSVPRQFHVVKEQKNWTEAQQYCREEFTDLATIDDMTEMEKVKSKIHEAGVNAWIGLKRGDWQWSLADRDFYGENEAEFRNWDTGQPNGGGEECGFMRFGGKWHDVWCSYSCPFICYDGGDSTHPYVLVTEEKTWADAQRYCREKHTDLASVRNQAENDQIKGVIPYSSHVNPVLYWIGLFRYTWSDGSSSTFRHWGAGEPNNLGVACTEIEPSGQWKDADCQHNDGSHFICYEDELVLVRENKTWREALQYCREHHVDLVSVTSERVQRWVSERAKGASTAHVWVGLLHSYGVGWYWVSGQNVSYSNWTQGHEQVGSDQHRLGAVESGRGQWVSDLTKTDQLNFICTTEEYKSNGQLNNESVPCTEMTVSDSKEVKRQIVRVEIKVASHVNIHDPAVQQAFLQQIQQRLRDSGMPADAKLTWMTQPDGKIFKEKEEKKEEGRKRTEL
ncbi:macrophage mannose receptor 1-like [Sardina pilchardus]|uniref:macrophage mannose receptor 1-like n=1 Tax=Sardina pilchardus TaxID=27697 RepID=UPI002E162334